MALFEKVVEPVGGEALEEEVGQGERVLRLCSLLLFLHSLLPECRCSVNSQPPTPATKPSLPAALTYPV